MDGNVKKINRTFFEENVFGAADPTKGLYVDVGYYELPYNIETELSSSLGQGRWAEYADDMQTHSLKYFEQLKRRLGPEGLANCRVASAKYTGINLRPPSLPFVSEWLMEQCKLHYQGNIILSYLACISKESVQSLTAIIDAPGISVLRQHGEADDPNGRPTEGTASGS